MKNKIYQQHGDTQTVYLKNVVADPNVEVGNYTMYNDFVHDPHDFEKNNILYHYPINGNKLMKLWHMTFLSKIDMETYSRSGVHCE